jgi:hypothetical protein
MPRLLSVRSHRSIALDEVLDLVCVICVVSQGRFDEASTERKVPGGRVNFPAFRVERLDNLPDVESMPSQGGSPAGRPFSEDNAWVLCHADRFFDVPFRQLRLGEPAESGLLQKLPDGGRLEAE